MQDSRTVIDSLLRKKPADRMGLTDGPWADTLRKWVTQGYPADAEGKPVSPVDHFGFDLAGCGGWFDRHARQGIEVIESETDEWKVVRNGDGAALKWWKDKSGTPEHIDFTMTDRLTWDKEFRPYLPGTARERVTAERIADTRKELERRKAEGKWTFYGHQFIWENMRGALGDMALYENLLLDPDWIRDYCRVYTDLYKECFTIFIEEAGKPDGVWLYEDLGYKERLFCSLAVYSELIFPYYREMVELFHSYDLPVILHTCGFVEPALDLIVETGFDGLHPMEVKAGNDPLKIAEEYGDRLVLIGGLDERILESGDRDLIGREVTALVEGMKERGARYIYASDHSISTNVDYGDFLHAVSVYREHMFY